MRRRRGKTEAGNSRRRSNEPGRTAGWRWAVVVAALWLVPCLAAAGQLDDMYYKMCHVPWGAEAVTIAHTILQQYPLGGNNAPETVPSEMAEIQAGATWVLANDLYETQNKPGEAVALCDAYFKVYPSSARFWARNLYQLWADTSALAPLPPEDALTRAQSVAKFLVEGNPLDPPTGLLAPQPGLIWDIVLLYQKGGQADQGRQFIEEFPYKVPDIVEEPLYWKARVMMYLAAGELELAKQAAVAGYRLTPLVSDPAADPPLQLLLRTLLLTDGKTTVVNFLRYLQTGQGDNPLGGVAPFPMTDEQRQEQTGIVGGVWARAVDACLLNGQYAEALHAAQVESLGAGPQADAGVTDIARCFKAKDLNCVRANQYLAWAKNPQGPNPVSSF